jgi:hypothetical protein
LPIGEWFEALQAGIGIVPPALIAIFLLGGPTAIWLLYRFVVQPHAARLRENAEANDAPTFWVCPECRSVNNIRRRWCYSCDAEPYEDELELIEAEPVVPPPLIPVGPGKSGPLRPVPRAIPVYSLENQSADEETEFEAERAELPDVAAMTEVVESPRRRRSA